MERDRVVKFRVRIGFHVLEGIQPLVPLLNCLGPENMGFKHLVTLVHSERVLEVVRDLDLSGAYFAECELVIGP